MKRLMILFCLLVLINSVSAVPFIGNAPNNIADGQSIVINGNGFGAKASAAPMEWLGGAADGFGNIEDGTDSSVFSRTSWTINLVSPIYTNTDSHSGGQSLKFNFTGGGSFIQTTFYSGAQRDIWYFTTWLKLVKKGSPTYFQWKFHRPVGIDYFVNTLNNTVLQIIPWYWADVDGWSKNNGIKSYYAGSGGLYGYTLDGSTDFSNDAFLFDTWFRFEGAYKVSSAPNTPDGVVQMTRVGKSGYIANTSSLITHDADDIKWSNIIIGQALESVSGDPNTSLVVYYDDIYIDNSWARVELCDSLIWSARIHCEIQPPTSWLATGDSITIDVNQGSFNDGEDVYLFVVDENGDVSNGRLVTLGDGLSNCGDADADEGGSVSITELINYISKWKSGDVLIGELITAIGEWKNGCS